MTHSLIRPILPQDAAAFQAFVQGLSLESRTNRFLFPVRELSPESLRALTSADQKRHVALVAVERGRIVGEGRYVRLGDSDRAEFAVAVADGLQRTGLGKRLLDALEAAAYKAGIGFLEGDILRTNHPMLQLMRVSGYGLRGCVGDARIVLAQKDLLEGDHRPDRRTRMHQVESLVYPV